MSNQPFSPHDFDSLYKALAYINLQPVLNDVQQAIEQCEILATLIVKYPDYLKIIAEVIQPEKLALLILDKTACSLFFNLLKSAPQAEQKFIDALVNQIVHLQVPDTMDDPLVFRDDHRAASISALNILIIQNLTCVSADSQQKILNQDPEKLFQSPLYNGPLHSFKALQERLKNINLLSSLLRPLADEDAGLLLISLITRQRHFDNTLIAPNLGLSVRTFDNNLGRLIYGLELFNVYFNGFNEGNPANRADNYKRSLECAGLFIFKEIEPGTPQRIVLRNLGELTMG